MTSLLVGGCRLERVDVAAVAQHRDAIGDAGELLHAVRDVDDAGVGRAEAADEVEQHVDLGVVQGGRRLVHDEHLGVEGERLGDLHHLLAGDGEALDRLVGVEREAETVEELLRPRR